MDLFFSSLLVIIVIIAVCNTIYSHIYKVVNMPSAPKTRRIICNDIMQNYSKETAITIIDCGSGWGGLCRKLSKHFPHATVIGYEISPFPYWASKIVSLVGNYTVHRQDIFKTDLSDADILICYLSPYHMDRFSDYMHGINFKDKILYSQGFSLEGNIPKAEWHIPFSIEKKLYKYKL